MHCSTTWLPRTHFPASETRRVVPARDRRRATTLLVDEGSRYHRSMGAMLLLGRSALRGRWRSHLALIALLTIGVGTALASFTTAWRTDHAYPDYLRRANVSHLVINPTIVTDRLLEVVRTTPGVESVTMSMLLTVETDDIDPALQAEFANVTLPLGSADGRYIDADRPAVVEGRMATADNEIFLNRGAADAYGLQVGDRIDVTFVPTQPNGPPPTDEPSPIATEPVEVVGIGVFADEILPDDLYPSVKIFFSPQLSARYSCVTKQPGPDDPRSIDELNELFFPDHCASDAALLALRLTEGDAGVDDVLAELDARFAAETARLPASVHENNFGFLVIPTVTSVEAERVRSSVEPVVLALRLFGLSALAAAVVLAAAAVYRTTRDTEADTRIWSQLGVARSQRMLAVAAPTAIGIAVGLAGAVLAAWLASGIGPVASVSVLDPSPSLGIPGAIVAAVVPAALVVLIVTLLIAARGVTSMAARQTTQQRPNRLSDAAAKTGDVPLALGVHAAVRGQSRGGAGLLLGASVVAIAVGTMALIYSTNLTATVSEPARYGWTYDLAATINAGFEGADVDGIDRTLDRPEVARWGVGATALSGTIDGVKLPAIADITGLAGLDVPTLEGVLPRNDHEVALGATSAERLDATVGDRVTVVTDFGERDAVITGIVVLPPFGAFLSDRAGLGTGIMLAAPFFQEIVNSAEAAAGVPHGTFYDTIGGFVAIDLSDGVDAQAFAGTLDDAIAGWDEFGRLPTLHVDPVRPAQIANLVSVKAAPSLLALLVALTSTVGLVAALGRAISVRRRELAILRALGCKGAQLYATTAWQALTVIVIGLVVGVPVGIIVGSALWRRFASDLGIMPAPTMPWAWLGLVVGAAIIVTVAAVILPCRRAVGGVPAATLRDTSPG
jgi:hypothetical protein